MPIIAAAAFDEPRFSPMTPAAADCHAATVYAMPHAAERADVFRVCLFSRHFVYLPRHTIACLPMTPPIVRRRLAPMPPPDAAMPMLIFAACHFARLRCRPLDAIILRYRLFRAAETVR